MIRTNRNIYICMYIYIRRRHPELERVRLHLQSTNAFQSCRLQSAITALSCNLPSCGLPATYTGVHLELLHHLKRVALPDNRGPQAGNLLAQRPSNPFQINENIWRSMKITSLATMGDGHWAIGNRRHRFCHQSDSHNGSRRNSTTRLNGFSLRVLLVVLKQTTN